MAKGSNLDAGDRIRVLRALAFQIQRKRPAEEALAEVLDQESKGGHNRTFRPAKEALEADGFLPSLMALEMFSPETASVMTVVIEAHDHRLLAGVLSALADHIQSST